VKVVVWRVWLPAAGLLPRADDACVSAGRRPWRLSGRQLGWSVDARFLPPPPAARPQVHVPSLTALGWRTGHEPRVCGVGCVESVN
jgi:hypothetical protein